MFLFYKLNKATHHYLNKAQRKLIADAFLFGADAHETQVRSSGEPYFTHPVAVACVLAGMRLDIETIIAALLHDVIEDTSFTSEDISKRYGSKTAELVEGVTKLTKIEFNTKAEQQAENFRKMILAMVQDIRVIIIKLADRLHNMTTLAPLRPDKRRRIANETLEIYAPIAHRLGMHHFKNSFEELAFEGIHPYRYQTLKTKVTHARAHRKRLFHKILEKLQHHLKEDVNDSNYITGRKKRLYSIYRKMRDRDMSFSEIMDIYAYKVIAKSRRDCYVILGAIHELFRPIPGRFKDYIATPKANGYQSLHTTVFGPYGVPVEVQIKTQMMDDTAERGVAAHWLYKSQPLSHNSAQKWLEKLSDLQQHVTKSVDFIESVKLDLFPDEVYVFTPNGEIIELPKSATCVDFAYHIHTDIGNNCIAAKVNRRISPLSYVLKHGDTIEIITSPAAHPNPAWLDFVKTARAKHAIKHALKRQAEDELLLMGKQILDQVLSKKSILISEIKQDILQEALAKFNFPGLNELYASIGNASFSANDFMFFIEEKVSKSNVQKAAEGMVQHIIASEHLKQIANCCTPIPDDPISAVLVPEKGVEIHRTQCDVLAEELHKGYATVDVSWGECANLSFPVRLYITVENIKGAIAQVSSTLTRKEVNIIGFNVTESDQQYAINEVLLEVNNRIQLAHIIRALKRLKICIKVERR
ncbi:RelA/SpoT family protein [Fangia hongkongensis]|uniref:RelA/SpoT family protein n=1 Tax=Fangia hongkongensis TaxID=270495 RepID=UPI0003816EF7|nr:bifunctional (p)ppGpp synthetase/guanosine-3',5'-bis(diphosphate) 3'-pyrophosphohydrolase [Fangia hongkongensis]MBK2124380.1 bifunctional (p)ppGpp synthetase/guanosine-3',5'-bis(diphosphate) 3'-pyrophosphohydrolase [Fangia hongkongensis]